MTIMLYAENHNFPNGKCTSVFKLGRGPLVSTFETQYVRQHVNMLEAFRNEQQVYGEIKWNFAVARYHVEAGYGILLAVAETDFCGLKVVVHAENETGLVMYEDHDYLGVRFKNGNISQYRLNEVSLVL